MSSPPTNTIMDIVRSRLKDNFSSEDSNQIGLIKSNSKRDPNFLNPKVFPLKRRRQDGNYFGYCSYLLNFDEERYPLPARLSPEDRSNRIEVDSEGVVVKYVGPGRSDSDAAAIRSTIPVPPQVGIYYFEMKVINRGRDGYIAAGFAIKSASLGRLTGWEPGTIGYHADDGNLYRGAGTGTAFGPSYTKNDVIGCGVNFSEKSFFFTKNGILIGEIGNLKDKFHLPFFPSVGCRTVGEILSLNFGKSSFIFDIEGHVQKKMKSHFEIPQGVKEYDFILSYLIHCGYKNSAKAFFKETKSTKCDTIIDEKELESSFKNAQNRRQVLEAIKQGKMEELGGILRNNFPSFLMENIPVAFKLECLNFIELIRSQEESSIDDSSSKEDRLNEIIENGKRLTSQFPPDVIKTNLKLLEDTLALLAYPKPSQSPISYLLQKSFKADLADEIDLALLKHEGKSPFSPLHHVLKQCQVVMDELQYIENSDVSLVNL